MNNFLKNVPEAEKIKAEIIVIVGFSASAMLFIFANNYSGNNGCIGNIISFVLDKLGFIKYLVCTIPIELSMNYYKKHIFYKYYLKKLFKAKPPILILIIKFIIRKFNCYRMLGGEKVEQ